MTVLVFFAAAAGTGIVAAGFFLDMHGHRLLFFGLSRLCRSLHARSLQLIDIDFGSLLAFALYVLGRILPYRDVGLGVLNTSALTLLSIFEKSWNDSSL